MTWASAIDREAHQAFVGPKGIEKEFIDEEHRPQIHSKPHPTLLPAEAAIRRAD